MFEILFLAGLIIAIGFASRWIFQKTRIPEVIILMFIGFALGPLGLAVYFGVPGGSMQFFQQAAPIAGAIAIISMVFEAGLRLKVKEFFGKLSMPMLSAFLNMGACIAAVAGALHFILGWGAADALIFGAMFGGMSSFAAYTTLPLVRTTNSLRNSLYLEGTLSTITISILAIALMRYGSIGGQSGIAGLAWTIFPLFSVSFILGIALGIVLLFLLLNFKVKRLSFSLLFAALLMTYFIDFSYLGGIGVISVAIIGFVLANSEDFFRMLKKNASFGEYEAFTAFHAETSLFINTFFFVYLGFIFRPEQFSLENILASALIVAAIIAARAAVTLALKKSSSPQRHENLLNAVMVPRDLLSATLATFLVIYRPGQPAFGIEIVGMVIALSTLYTSAGINFYERIFRDTLLFRKDVALSDGRTAVVRGFTKDDFGKLRKFFNGLVAEGAYIAIDHRLSGDEEREMGEETLAKMNRREMVVWVAEHEGKIVARAAAEKMAGRERDNVSLSFYVAKGFRGAGLGTVLIRMLVKESFRVFSPRNLYLTVYSDNREAIRLYEREGFAKVGVLSGWMKHNNDYLDRVYMVYGKKKTRRENGGG